MFDIEYALKNYFDKVNSIIIDLSDVEHMKEGFKGKVPEVIKYIDSMINQIHGFRLNGDDFLSTKLVFGKKRRASAWRFILEPTSTSFIACPLYLRLKKEDLEKFIKQPLSDKFSGFFLHFESRDDLNAYIKEKSPLFAFQRYGNKCYIENDHPINVDISSLCQETYVDTSYIKSKGFYRN